MQFVVSPRLLSDRQILLDQELDTPDDLFSLIGNLIGRGDPWQARVVREGLSLRHGRASTALGGGVALPHAAVPGLTRPRAVYVRNRKPIPMGAPDDVGITDVLALLVPKPGFQDHYQALMRMKDAVLEEPFMARLRRAGSPMDVLRLLTGEVF